FLWPFHDAAASGRIAGRKLFVDQGPLPARHSRASSGSGVADQRPSADYGSDKFLDDTPDTEKRRSHPAAHDDVHAHHLYRLLLQFCRCPCLVLHCAKPFQYSATLPKPETTDADFREIAETSP